MLTALTRTQFDHACKAYVDAHPNTRLATVTTHSSGWIWNEHPYIANLGYLSRTARFPRRSSHHAQSRVDDVVDECLLVSEEDEAIGGTAGDMLSCSQYVVHSATFQVPTFYFTLHDSSGSPLALDEIVKSPLFRPHALPSVDGNTFALTLPDSSLALLSQGDHPTLGTPSWYFHPCHTAEVVGELMVEMEDGQDDMLRWMETWFMVMGNMVDLFAGV